MKIINESLKKGYLIHEDSTGTFSVCRILNDYDNKEDATSDLVKLLGKKKTEEDLLREYTGIKSNKFFEIN